MVDDNVLWVYGIAQYKAIRKFIRYSENISSIYAGYEESELYKTRKHDYGLWKDNISLKNNSTKFIDLAYDCDYMNWILSKQVGYCGELSYLSTLIARYSDVKFHEKAFSTLLLTDSHAFSLIHQDINVHLKQHGCVVANSIKDLVLKIKPQNAVINDSWIYKATKLKKLSDHIEQINQYRVGKYYLGKVKAMGISTEIGAMASEYQDNTMFSQVVEEFESYYCKERQKLFMPKGYHPPGRRMSDVRRSISDRIDRDKLQRQQQIKEVRDVLKNLNAGSSGWYSGFGHSDRKGMYFKGIINHLEKAVNLEPPLSRNKLAWLFHAGLKLSPVVRGASKPKVITFKNIKVTATSKAIFSNKILSAKRYEFENISNMNLDWAREIKKTSNDPKVRHKLLCQHLFKVKDDDDLYPILYSNHGKALYYSEIDELLKNGIYQ
ncbi:MAG: hypothetical protein GY750_15240 [Lentisphaerae bacterium]|nr:hypothetical protein [Lentisphaerota bacterium]MCP4102752.1 hypothetical protein [Lentisphaerota bacterium]